ncbi:REST corepressor 3, partial [Cichlidogyrus casuarinus]
MLTRGRLSSQAGSENEANDFFEDAEIRVGMNYQAFLPALQKKSQFYDATSSPYEISLWNPIEDREHRLEEFINEATVRHTYSEEQALALLKWHRFNFVNASKDLPNFKPVKTSWSLSQQRDFFSAIEASKKQKISVLADLHISQSKWKQLYEMGLVRQDRSAFMKKLDRRNLREKLKKPLVLKDLERKTNVDPLDLKIVRYLDRNCTLASVHSQKFVAHNMLNTSCSHFKIYQPKTLYIDSDSESLTSDLFPTPRKHTSQKRVYSWISQRTGTKMSPKKQKLVHLEGREEEIRLSKQKEASEPVLAKLGDESVMITPMEVRVEIKDSD